MRLRICSVSAIAAAAALWLASGTQREKQVIAATVDGHPSPVAALEGHVAAHPEDAEATRALAQAYLEARQPGLAVALVEESPEAVRGDVRVGHVLARALVDAGRNPEALAAEKRVVAACRPAADGRGVAVAAAAAARGCDNVLLASAMRRVDILSELVSLGVNDTQAHPETSMVAYQNATREARVMVQ